MSLSKSGSIGCNANHCPAYLSHPFIHIDPFPPWLNKPDAQHSLNGAVICPVMKIQILKFLPE